MKRKIKKIWNCVNGILISLVILLAIALVGVRAFGVELYVVLSGSMQPVYQTGSVIYVKEIDTEQLQVGDVITFAMGQDTTATHRIIEVLELEGQTSFRTKGDANDVEDGSAVLASQVIGSPIFTIPQLGYLVAFMQSESGRYAMISVAAFLLLMICLPDMLFGTDEKKSEHTLGEKTSTEQKSKEQEMQEQNDTKLESEQ